MEETISLLRNGLNNLHHNFMRNARCFMHRLKTLSSRWALLGLVLLAIVLFGGCAGYIQDSMVVPQRMRQDWALNWPPAARPEEYRDQLLDLWKRVPEGALWMEWAEQTTDGQRWGIIVAYNDDAETFLVVASWVAGHGAMEERQCKRIPFEYFARYYADKLRGSYYARVLPWKNELLGVLLSTKTREGWSSTVFANPPGLFVAEDGCLKAPDKLELFWDNQGYWSNQMGSMLDAQRVLIPLLIDMRDQPELVVAPPVTEVPQTRSGSIWEDFDFEGSGE